MSPPRSANFMLHQTFAVGDIPVVLLLVLLEGLLSADNALVLAIMVRHLPPKQQQQALSLGLGMSFLFRVVAIILAGFVIKLWWLQAVGAFYLLYLPINHFRQHSQHGRETTAKGGTFAQTVVALGIADVAFAIDSVLAAVATVGGKQEKTWVVIVGALLGVILLRYAAGLFLRLLDKYPALDHLAYVLVGWVGVKLVFMSLHSFAAATGRSGMPEMPGYVFWAGMGIIIALGLWFAVKNPHVEDEAEDLEGAADQVDAALDEPDAETLPQTPAVSEHERS